MNYLYLLVIIEFCLLLFVLGYTHTDILSPSFITLSFYFLSTLCIIWNEEYWDVKFESKTCYVVSIVLFSVVIMEFFINNLYSRKKTKWIDMIDYADSGPVKFDPLVKIAFTLITTIMTIIYILFVIKAGSANFKTALSAIAVVHGDEEVSIGILGTISVRLIRIIAYPCIYFLVNNVIGCREHLKNNIWLLIIITECFLVAFFTGVRSTYLYYLFASFFYLIMIERFKNGWREIDIKKYVFPILIFATLFLLIFLGSRSIVKGHEFTSTGIEYITFYLGSPLHLFNKIINDTTAAFPTHYENIIGAHTFKWFYQELYKFGLIDTLVEDTRFNYVGGEFYGGGNVYTMFAYTLHDFGYFGMYIFILALYYIFISIYYKKFKYCTFIKKQQTSLLIYGSFYHIVLMTFYCVLTSQLKLQTILEIFIMIILFKYLPKLKIRI